MEGYSCTVSFDHGHPETVTIPALSVADGRVFLNKVLDFTGRDHLEVATLTSGTAVSPALRHGRTYAATTRAAVKTIASHGLPELGKGGSSGGSWKSKHERVRATAGVFGVSQLNLSQPTSAIWIAQRQGSTKWWQTERDIQQFVKFVLGDVAECVNIRGNVLCVNEASIHELRPDVWLVLVDSKYPIGVVKVMKPEAGILDDERIVGQLHDYLVLLQSFHGLKNVFGILSTYQEWRVCWLASQDTDALAARTDVTTATTVHPPVFQGAALTERNVVVPVTPSKAMAKRVVKATPVLKWNDPSLVPTLATALLKMTACKMKRAVKELDNKRTYLFMDENKWYFTTVAWQISKLQLTVPPPDCKNLIMIRDLRFGTDGRVWKAATEAGRTCVLKFGSHENPSALVEECDFHRKLAQPAKMAKFAGSACLMLPVYFPVPDHLWSDAAFVQTVGRFVFETLNHCGIIHAAPARRHVMMEDPDFRKGIEFPWKQLRWIDLARSTQGTPIVEDVLSKLLQES
eukprot:TRINITY_DN11576_c0_g1_i1.p1 TRINITY_DN11576_c0_g1~~TRINITY_DN11576_c0_g1_i1.p1  ORF type:complete len:517 (-),score=81.98 TRINITY_DN11576_c0_g1_i1:16-1566(-)